MRNKRKMSPAQKSQEFVWRLIALILAAILLATSWRRPCPYVWHGGAPGGNPAGSCWVGASDNYAMCTPSLAIDLVIESGDDAGIIFVLRRDNGLYATMGGEWTSFYA